MSRSDAVELVQRQRRHDAARRQRRHRRREHADRRQPQVARRTSHRRRDAPDWRARMVRVDGIYRTWTDFYYSARDTATGTVLDPQHRPRPDAHRQQRRSGAYAAMNLQAAYRPARAAGTCTRSTRCRARGGTSTVRRSTTVRSSPGPPRRQRQHRPDGMGRLSWLLPWRREPPVGDLATDQRHRAWLGPSGSCRCRSASAPSASAPSSSSTPAALLPPTRSTRFRS